ncbi:MAG: response regulator transcription factor [Pseudomonadota bacterium]
MKDRTKTIVIADDHALVRNGIKDVFATIEDTQVVGEAENGLEAIALGKSLRPTLMTLDAGMPLCKGMEVYGEVRRWSPETRIAVVTGFTAVGSLADWVSAGVDGLFLKSCTPEEMRKGFDLILKGGGYVEKQVLTILKEAPEEEGLTPRERQILHLVAEGCSNAEIADRLSISPKTVDNHRTRLMAKLGVRSVAQLLAYALKEGLLDSASQN